MFDTMSPSALEPMMVFSVSPEKQQFFELLAGMEGWKIKPVQGSYKGQEERSYVMPAEHLPDIEHPWLDGQETVLLLGPWNGLYREARMLDLASGIVSWLGRWQTANERTARSRDGWTYDPLTEQWFIVEPAPAPARGASV